MLVPTTGAGRWSVLAAGIFAVFMAVFALMAASGQRGGEGFFDNLRLTVPILTAYVAGVAAFILGAGAIAAAGERSVSVFTVTIVGLFVTTFGVLEVAFPH